MATKKSLSPAPQSKAPWIIGGVIAALLLIGAVVAVVNIAPFISTIASSAQKNSNYSQRVEAVEAQPTKIAPGETLKSGPVSIKVTGTERHYQPTERDATYIESLRMKDLSKKESDVESKWYSWNTDAVEYVLVRTDVEYDVDGVNKGTVYPMSADDTWVTIASNVRIGETKPVITWVGEAYEPARTYFSDDNIDELESGRTIVVTYLFRVPQGSSTTTMNFETTIYAKVSSFVGTEGMPRKKLTYTVTLP